MICPTVLSECKSQAREKDGLEGTRDFKKEKEMDTLPSGGVSTCPRPAPRVHTEKPEGTTLGRSSGGNKGLPACWPRSCFSDDSQGSSQT